MSKNEWFIAFAPITLLSAGGFLAMEYLKNRESTGDLDYIIEPQRANDDDIKLPLSAAMVKAAGRASLTEDWAKDEMSFFVPGWAREKLLEEAEKQNIVLWQGANLRILAVPLTWALERRLRRIHNSRQTNDRHQ